MDELTKMEREMARLAKEPKVLPANSQIQRRNLAWCDRCGRRWSLLSLEPCAKCGAMVCEACRQFRELAPREPGDPASGATVPAPKEERRQYECGSCYTERTGQPWL